MWQEHGSTPRSVSLATRLAIANGGVLGFMGWMFLGIGLVAVQAFGVFGTIAGMWHFSGDVAEAPGTYEGSSGTSTEINDTPVYAHRYRFVADDGREYGGQSYSTGSWSPPGATITIEYPVGRPEVSRIRGLRDSIVGPFILFTLIFPVVGFFLLLPGWRRGHRVNRLLVHGKVTSGELVDKQPTNTRINKQTVYKYTFRFTDESGSEYEATGRTHRGELEDDDRETVLYDPSDPRNACTVDDLPGSPVIEDGAVRTRTSPLVMLILPTLVVVGHTTWFVLAN
jgi:hypothetical protein